MPLSEEQIGKVKAWFAAHGVRGDCPQCGHREHSTADLISAPNFTPGSMIIGGPTVPMLPVICNNCGHVRLFAAVLMGLMS